ncbi:MAG: hypothetical protein WC763_01235 [Candidatus Paceibacterota bacterium]|jgi:hypothetical protein
MNFVSIKTTPINLRDVGRLETWLRMQNLEVALDQDMPEDWKGILEMKHGCIVRRIIYGEPTKRQKSVGFELVPGDIILGTISREGYVPLISNHEILIPEGQLVLVKKRRRIPKINKATP